MVWVPQYKIYASDGLTLVYTFNFVQTDNSPQTSKKSVIISGHRGNGDIVVSGSDASWDITLGFCLVASNYQALIALMDSMETTILPNTKYILKIDRTPSTTKNYNVMLLSAIEWEPSKRTKVQKGHITFKINSW